MSKRLLERFAGWEEFVHVDRENPGNLIIEERQDCTHIVEAASIMADETPGKDFRHTAYVPQHELNRAFREGWFHDKIAWKRWLNDPDNKKFRTWGGRV